MARVPKKITRRWAQRREACEGQVEIFAKEWPDGAELTRANLMRAAALGLSVAWLAVDLLLPNTGAERWTDYRILRQRALRRWLDGPASPRRWRTYQHACAKALADILGLEE